MYIVANHGASPSGRLELVDGRDLWPELDIGLLFSLTDEDAALGLVWLVEVARVVPLAIEFLRAPEVGVALLDILDLGSETDVGELFCGEPCTCELAGRDRGVAVPSCSSSMVWLPMLWLRILCLLYAMPSSQLPLQAPLPFRLRGNGESRSTTVCGTGMGLFFEIGKREVPGLMAVCRHFCCSCSAATSSGVRNSKSIAPS